MDGFADHRRAATPAALGAAALVPKNGLKPPPKLVDTPSAAATSGFRRTSGLASGWPSASKKRVMDGPLELKSSGSFRPESRGSNAATASEPAADAASGSTPPVVSVNSTGSAPVKAPFATHLTTGVPAPATRRI